MRKILIFILALFASVGSSQDAHGEEPVILQVTVTSTSGTSVFIDKGSSQGVVAGLSVRLSPPEGAPVTAVVRFVSTNRARADLPPGIDVPPIGTRGEIEVPAAPRRQPGPLDTPDKATPDKQAPAHPPWTRDMSQDGKDAPLLAPTQGQRAEDRPIQITGRVYFNSLYTHDQSAGRNDDFYTGRLGTSAEAANPFGLGGRLMFDGEVNNRSQFLTDGENSFEYDGQVEILSYAIGGQDYVPYRVEVGRFYSIYLPELGLVDGAEGSLHLENGLLIGVGGGLYPLSSEDPEWGEDYGVHLFVNYESDTPGRFSGILGYQKTWHKGEEDRDQILGRVNSRIGDKLWIYGSIRVDVYGQDDKIKGQGIELTEMWTQVRYTPDPRYGGSVSYSLFRWPELMRDQFAALPVAIITDGQVDRVNFSGWNKVSDTVRLSGKFDLWEDQNDSGTGGELRTDWNDRKTDWPSISATVFFTEGSFNAGEGFRTEGRKTIKSADVFLGYEFFSYDVETMTGGQDTLIRQLVRSGVSWASGKWYYSVTGDHYFGDTDDEYTLGTFISRRF